MDNLLLMKSQKHARKQVRDWFCHRTHRQQIFRLYGYAGVGQSTIVSYVVGDLGLDYADVRFATLIGKAAPALRRTGLGD